MKQLYIAILEENMKALEEIITFYMDELDLITQEHESLIERLQLPENIVEEFERTILEIISDTEMKEVEEVHDCDTCQYDGIISIFDSPCRECLRSDSEEPIYWEPIEEEEEDEEECVECTTCTHKCTEFKKFLLTRLDIARELKL